MTESELSLVISLEDPPALPQRLSRGENLSVLSSRSQEPGGEFGQARLSPGPSLLQALLPWLATKKSDPLGVIRQNDLDLTGAGLGKPGADQDTSEGFRLHIPGDRQSAEPSEHTPGFGSIEALDFRANFLDEFLKLFGGEPDQLSAGGLTSTGLALEIDCLLGVVGSLLAFRRFGRFCQGHVQFCCRFSPRPNRTPSPRNLTDNQTRAVVLPTQSAAGKIPASFLRLMFLRGERAFWLKARGGQPRSAGTSNVCFQDIMRTRVCDLWTSRSRKYEWHGVKFSHSVMLLPGARVEARRQSQWAAGSAFT
jgi:hypothetical protein